LQEFIEVTADLYNEFDAAVITGELPSKFRVMVMIGVTGHGISSTCNSICGDNHFKAAATSKSVT
jgi:hypothetical protein